MREENKLALIVVDTLLGVSGGGNTADTADMQAIIDVAKMLATVLDCAVEIINHLTKGGAKSDPDSMDAGLGARPVTATAQLRRQPDQSERRGHDHDGETKLHGRATRNAMFRVQAVDVLDRYP